MFRILLTFQLFALTLSGVKGQGQMVPLGISPQDFVEAELAAFELERDEFLSSTVHDAQHRGKRTVMFNGLAPIDLGMLFGIPLSLALPSLSNYFQFNLNKVKRSADEDVAAIEEDPILQDQVQRIDGYFQLIRIPERPCQERAVCEFSADPTKFFPISELTLNRLQRNGLTAPRRDWSTETLEADLRNGTTYFRFIAAAALGELNGPNACESQFSARCPIETERRLNMDALNFWNLLSKMLSLRLKDDLDI